MEKGLPTNVVTLPTAQNDVVKQLEGLLALAQRGELLAIAYATVEADWQAGSSWAQKSSDTYQELSCGVNTLAVRINAAIAGL